MPLTFGGIGDAYGFCFEFTDPDFVAENNDLRFHQHPEFIEVRPGAYSDDTQMQLALAEVIASEKDWTPENIADAFVDVFHRDPRPGYAHRFHAFLQSVQSGKEFLARIRPQSERNGAAMRAPVIGLFSDLNEVVTRSELQAKLTHDTRGGVDSAITAALMAHFFAYNLGAKEELPAFLDSHVPGYNWAEPWHGEVPCHGVSTVRAALTAIEQSDHLSDLLINCVAFTGDVDSVATIALASASGHAGFTRDIPEQLWNSFEPSQYGLEYLLDLDRRVRAIAFQSGTR